MSRGVDGVKGVQSVNRGVNGVEGIQTEPWRGWCGGVQTVSRGAGGVEEVQTLNRGVDGVKTLPVSRGEGNGSDSTFNSQSWWGLH